LFLKQELANIYVVNNLEFFPCISDGTTMVDRLCYSYKWREDLPRQYRAQMVVSREKHFYIYEPTQLITGEVVVPLFFYKCKDVLLSKCITPQYSNDIDTNVTHIILPSNVRFNDQALLTIEVKQFHLIYSEITLQDGQYLSQFCRNVLYGM
jgi:hypothetical protein